MEADILQQLVWIKWILALMLAGTIVRVFASVYAMLAGFSRTRKKAATSFGEDLSDLLDKGENEKVFELTEKRLQEYPADAMAHWYHGKACLFLGQNAAAVQSLKRAKELRPDWAEDYIDSFLEVAEVRAKNSKSRPFRLVAAPESDKADSPDD